MVCLSAASKTEYAQLDKSRKNLKLKNAIYEKSIIYTDHHC